MRLDFEPNNPDLVRILDQLHVAFFTVDHELRVVGWSQGATELTGRPAAEVCGASVGALDSGGERGLATLCAKLWADQGCGVVNGLVTVVHKGGALLTLLGELRVAFDGERRVGIAGVLTALGVHMQANQRLAEVVSPERARRAFHQLVGESEAMAAVFEQLEQAAGVDVTVLIRGETGTGKELAARAIHASSRRKTAPLVCVNCAAIPEPLLESELFGHVKGAFTGATRDKIGVFEAASGGVLFLDEIGDLGPSVQVKLLRALQEREIRRLGSLKSVKIDVRIVSATHRDLAALVAAGQFREDLYYRIRVFELNLPPLRKRRGDLRLLAEHFLREFNAQHGRRVRTLSPEAWAALERYPWPGNVRELRNALEHAFVTVRGDVLELGNLPGEVGGASPEVQPLEEAHGEREQIVAALQQAGGKKALAASLLGISRVTLWKKLKRLGINPRYVS
ncbi:MAG: sigma 54-interacting transcriptional regulator [Planctomycetes bacterium]|nr:sigma 54-interacting transcriptional regulator [Planctomycetota bacterium]